MAQNARNLTRKSLYEVRKVKFYISQVVDSPHCCMVLTHGTIFRANGQRLLKAFNIQCQQRILGIQWYDFAPNANMTAQINIPDINALIKIRPLDAFHLELLLMMRSRQHWMQCPEGLQVTAGCESQDDLATRGSDRLDRTVICKLPS